MQEKNQTLRENWKTEDCKHRSVCRRTCLQVIFCCNLQRNIYAMFAQSCARTLQLIYHSAIEKHLQKFFFPKLNKIINYERRWGKMRGPCVRRVSIGRFVVGREKKLCAKHKLLTQYCWMAARTLSYPLENPDESTWKEKVSFWRRVIFLYFYYYSCGHWNVYLR